MGGSESKVNTDAALLITTREREVWMPEEKRLLDRLAKVFNQHGDKLQLICGNPVCPAPKMTLSRDDSHPGGRVLRCGCRDRVFTRYASTRPLKH